MELHPLFVVSLLRRDLLGVLFCRCARSTRTPPHAPPARHAHRAPLALPPSGWAYLNPSLTSRHNSTLSTLRSGLWGQLEWRFLRTHLLLGSRVNYFEDTGEVLFQPRFTVRYTPGFGTILKLGGGMYTTQLDLLTQDHQDL